MFCLDISLSMYTVSLAIQTLVVNLS